MKKNFWLMGLLFLCGLSFASCGGNNAPKPQEVSEKTAEEKGVFADLVDVYIDMAELSLKMEDKFNKKDLSNEDAKEMMTQMQEYEKKAKEMGASYQGKAFKFESSEASGVTFSDGIIASVISGLVLQVNFRAKPSAAMADPIYAFFLDSKNNLVHKTIGSFWKNDGLVNVTLHVAVSGRRNTTPVETWKKIATIAKIMVVSKEEYEADVVPVAGKGVVKKAETQQSTSKFVMTDNGVDQITIGANINKLPKSIDGLYDKVVVKSEHNDMEDETTTMATFTLKGKEVMSAMADDDNKVCYISVQTPSVAVKIGDSYFQVGSPLKDLMKANGVKKDESYAAVYGKIQFDEDVNHQICGLSVGSAW